MVINPPEDWMTDGTEMFLVQGRSAGVNGHGSVKWSVSVRELAHGRSKVADLRPFTGRPALARALVPALREMSKEPLTRSSFKTGLLHLQSFWRFVDEVEAASKASGGAFHAPTSVFEIPGVVWALFKDWLDAQAISSQHFTYYHCKRAFDLAASLSDPIIAAQTGYPLPLNPFPNPQKVAARTGQAEDKFLEPNTIRAAAEVLLDHVRATTSRIQGARQRVTLVADGSLSPSNRFHNFAVERNWNLDAPSTPYDAFADFEPVKSGHGIGRLAGRAWWFVPNQDDLLPAFCLVMLRTGWNTSTTRDMNAEDWARDHPTRPAQLIQLV